MRPRKDELEAVLAGFVQGIIAIDPAGDVMNINRAAANLLGVKRKSVIGQPIESVIHNDTLRRMVLDAINEDDPVEGAVEIDLRQPRSPRPGDTNAARDPAAGDAGTDRRFVRVQDTRIRDRRGGTIARVIALQDLTRLRHLERVRRDFVANVSHEIKTPITAVKAAAETLQAAPPDDPQEAQQFLSIIARQADRLQAIVEDLLTLASIEQEAEGHEIETQRCDVSRMISRIVEACAPRAEAKSIHIQCQIPSGLVVVAHQQMLEQAIGNLLDNAVKYSPEETTVTLDVTEAGGEYVFSVQDQGPGIESHQLPRVFERFYRTDKARSREMGGTGLGLSIAKHVAQAHGGRATAESTVGQGSLFRICIPVR